MFLKLYFSTVQKFLYKDIGVFTIQTVLLSMCFIKLFWLFGYISVSYYILTYSAFNTFFAILLLYPYYMGFIQLNYWIFLTPKDEEYLKILIEK